MATPQRTIRIDDETWRRWIAATQDADNDVDDVSELIRVAVERYLEPSAEVRRARRQVEAAFRALADLQQRAGKSIETLNALADPR